MDGIDSLMKEQISSDFIPKQTLDAALRLWWMVAAMMFLGAGVGWVIHAFQPAIYEGRASLSTGIDYVRTGVLTDLEEDQAMGLIGDVITATDTLIRTVELVNDQGFVISVNDLKANGYSERRNFTWVLRVQHVDPQTAAILTNAWLDSAYGMLVEAYEHALIAEELLNYTRSLTSCLEKSTVVEPVHAYCTAKNLEEIQKELVAVNAAKKEEILASRGLFPAMAFAISERSEVPAVPVQYGRNKLVLAGAILGFILAVFLIYWQKPLSLFERVHRG